MKRYLIEGLKLVAVVALFAAVWSAVFLIIP